VTGIVANGANLITDDTHPFPICHSTPIIALSVITPAGCSRVILQRDPRARTLSCSIAGGDDARTDRSGGFTGRDRA